MQKRIKTFLAVILLCFASAIIVGFYLFNKPHESVAASSAAVKITAEKLFDEYAANEATSDKIFLNKVIEVHGKADEVTLQSNHCLILLKAGKSGGINCEMMMKDTALLNSLKAGDAVIIKGRCSGFLMDVNLVDCVIIK